MTDLVKPLVASNDPVLRSITERFDFDNPPMDPVELAHTLAQTMLAKGGLGLASPQLGLPYRACVIKTNPLLCMFNPKIVDQSTKTIELEEGCLSLPGLVLKVTRPELIKVRYQLPNGTFETNKYVGVTARVIQHEIDHLNGILITDHVSRLELDIARRKAKKRK